MRLSEVGLTRAAVVLLGAGAWTAGAAAADEAVGDGVGVFVWFDSAVWSSTTEWFNNNATTCIFPVGPDQTKYLKPLSTILADQQGTGFTNLRALVTDDASAVPMPTGAALNNGNVFVIATSLDPTGLNEFQPWSALDDASVPSCYGTLATAKDMTYTAFHAYVKQMLNPSSGDAVPVSLMFSTERSLRWGRILSSAQHLDPTDQVYFGGLTEMNASSTAPNIETGDLAGGRWSIHWPENATTSTVDDVDMTLNFIDRCIDFATYCNTQADLGGSPVIDIYLDLELFQLNHVAPTGIATGAFGTQYPGIADMPTACLQNMGWWDSSTNQPAVDTYWSAPANAADAFWRTLRMCRTAIDAYNTSAGAGDVKLTLSVWVQEAYRFCSPRFGILDTTVSADSWQTDSSQNDYGRFNKPFGTAQVKRRTGGTDAAPTYTAEDWTCDCARLDPTAGAGNAQYEMATPVTDDFNINNCIFTYVDRVAYGTYQSVPVGLVQPKGLWDKNLFRNNTAVDMAGTPLASAPDAHKIVPGMGLPLGGVGYNVPIKFAEVGSFAPTAVQSNENGQLADGGWLLYPPDFDGDGTVAWNRYYYNAIGAWPQNGTTATPDWTGFTGQDDCGDYWGAYDMPYQGWVPFAARMLTAVDQWSMHNAGASSPTLIMTLELTPLDSSQAGSGKQGVCFKNSLGNQWVWGDTSGTTTCASGTTASGTNNWPTVMISSLCQADRVTYIFGGQPGATTQQGDLVIGNSWGFSPASRLFAATNGPSGAALSSHLDATTPYAFNNHFSYHCLMTHDPLSGFYTSTSAYGADPVTGERSCWTPWDDSKFGGCACPAATQFSSPVSSFVYLTGAPGDVTGDHQTNIDDLLGVVERWNQPCPRPCIYDHDDDGLVEIGDLLEVIDEWGTNWN